MFNDPTLWIAIALAIFFALLIHKKVPQLIAGALDKRAAAISAELEAARALREEAQKVLADYQRRQRNAKQEANSIITQAKAEAERLAHESQQNLKENLERRTRLGEDKIAQAESQAINEVRDAAANLATHAAGRVIAEEIRGKKGDQLIEDSIKAVKGQLH